MALQRKGLRSMEQSREATNSTTQICPTDFDKGTEAIQQRKEPFHLMVLHQLHSQRQKNKPLPKPYTL